MVDSKIALYAISVAADLSGTTIQNLRFYERSGLLAPGRTVGGTRRYSEHDVTLLVHIRQLLDDGLNVAGVLKVLELEAEVDRLRVAVARRRS